MFGNPHIGRWVFGVLGIRPKPVDLLGRDDRNEDLLFAQDAWTSGQFVQQWKLRMMALEATLKEVANGKWRRLLARNKSFICTNVKISDSAIF